MRWKYFSKKAISMALIFCLILLFNSEVFSAAAGKKKRTGEAGLDRAATEETQVNYLEKSGMEVKIRPRRFPWFPVVVLLAAGAAAVYFLLIKNIAKEEGFRDDFSGTASPLWRPRSPSFWEVVADTYQCRDLNINHSETNYVDRTFSANNLTIETRLQQSMGDIGQYQGVFFVTATTMTAVSGFEFRIFTNMLGQGAFSIVRYESSNLTSLSPASTAVAAYTVSTAIGGDRSWNTVRIIRAGSTYSFYCNGVLLHSFSDGSLDPAVAGLRLWSDADPHILNCDFFNVEIN
ncbi:MAG: hypothetical protein JXI33_03195 [Candidatus Aminicenantes bacterium]|nr:hypothetical protein [Candidatus Aminicenantes bacterium]